VEGLIAPVPVYTAEPPETREGTPKAVGTKDKAYPGQQKQKHCLENTGRGNLLTQAIISDQAVTRMG
jgi:hypothetical protein